MIKPQILPLPRCELTQRVENLTQDFVTCIRYNHLTLHDRLQIDLH